jgi:hypothetical protein
MLNVLKKIVLSHFSEKYNPILPLEESRANNYNPFVIQVGIKKNPLVLFESPRSTER